MPGRPNSRSFPAFSRFRGSLVVMVTDDEEFSTLIEKLDRARFWLSTL
jgi:hypothetical protein